MSEWEQPGVCLTEELIDSFLSSLEQKGRKRGTINKYKGDLMKLYAFMPEDKMLNKDTLKEWQNKLIAENKAPKTVNACVSAVNSLYEYIDRRNWQTDRIREEERTQPELTRTEYLRLLQTAKGLGKERLYFLVKVFCCTGISVSDLSLITVELVKDGKSRGMNVHIPECLKTDLLNYAAREGIRNGPIFVTRNGRALDRTNASNSMKQLCRDAHIEEEKVNPRCLKKLYESTYSSIRESIDLLVEQAYDRLIESEQLTAGWDEN